MKQVKRILRENTTVDTQTGEVLQRETTVQFSKEPAYVKLYLIALARTSRMMGSLRAVTTCSSKF